VVAAATLGTGDSQVRREERRCGKIIFWNK
jgi:hypothetical protein